MAKKVLGSCVKSRIMNEEEEEEVRVVSVIYYIARNGQLEHPHLMELPLSSSHTILSLKDVINRFNFLRGQGMAHSYSWSAKRSYKKGYVWQDLSENDFIYPCNDQNDEYILQATQLFQVSFSSIYSSETTSSTTDSDSPAGSTKKMMMRTMKTKTKEAWKLATINASTQKDENQEKEMKVTNKMLSSVIIMVRLPRLLYQFLGILLKSRPRRHQRENIAEWRMKIRVGK